MINMFDITELYLYLLPPSVLITEHFKSLSSLFFQLNGASSTFFSSEPFFVCNLFGIFHLSNFHLTLQIKKASIPLLSHFSPSTIKSCLRGFFVALFLKRNLLFDKVSGFCLPNFCNTSSAYLTYPQQLLILHCF